MKAAKIAFLFLSFLFLIGANASGNGKVCDSLPNQRLPYAASGAIATQTIFLPSSSNFAVNDSVFFETYLGSIRLQKPVSLSSLMLVLHPGLGSLPSETEVAINVVLSNPSVTPHIFYRTTVGSLQSGYLLSGLPLSDCIQIHLSAKAPFRQSFEPVGFDLLWWEAEDRPRAENPRKAKSELTPFSQTNTSCAQASCITNNLPTQNNTGVPNTPWPAPGGCWGITDNPLFYRFHIFDNNPVSLQIANITCGGGQSLQSAVYSGSCASPTLLSTANCNVNQTVIPLVSVNGSNSQLHYTNMSPVPPPVTLPPGSYLLVIDGDQNSSCTFNFTGTALQPIRITTNLSNTTVSSQQCGLGIQFNSSGFAGSPSPPNATYSWTGPNGFSSNQQNPSIPVVTPSHSGTYTLTITVNGCVYTTTHFLNVTTPPNVILPASTIACGQSVNLTAPPPLPNAPNPTYSWSGPGGWTATGANAVRNCTNNCNQIGGVYTLTETYAPGCTRNVTQQVNIAPAFTLNLTHDWTSCNQTQLCFTANATPAQTGLNYTFSGLSWTPPSQAANTICKTPSSGVYSLSAALANGCQVNTTLNVNPPPAPIVTLTHDWLNCSQNQLCLTASGFPGSGSYTFAGPPNWNPPAQAANTICKNPPLHQGTYSVTVIANGCTSNATVTIQQPQIPPFPHTFPQPQCGMSQLCFSVTYPTANCPSPGHEWIGPGFNNANKNQMNPCITPPTTTGLYHLKFWCGNCYDSIPWSFTPPKPNIILSGNGILCGQNITFTALPPPNNSQPATYTWAGPCGFSATGTPVTHINPCSSGTYTVTMTTPLGTCEQTTYVIANVLPTMSISVNPNFVRCNDNVAFTPHISHNAASLITSYNWSGPCGFASTQSQPTISNVYSCHQGIYSLSVNLQNCPTALFTAVSLNINPILPPNASANPANVICGSNSVNFSASPGFQTYSWAGPCSLNNSNAQNATLSNPANVCSGVYTVNVTANNGFCNSSATTSINVNNIPAPNSSATSTICPGDTLFLTINASDPNWQGATFQWKKNNVVVANSPNHNFIPPNVTQITTETYTAVAILGSCTTTTNHTVNIYPLPTPPLTFNSNQPICQGQTLHLTSSADNAQFYYWQGPNGFSVTTATGNTSKANVTLADAGVYSVMRQLFGNPCKSNPITHTVTIHPLASSPTAPNVARCGAGIVTFSAALGAGPTPGNQVNLFTAPTGGAPISTDNTPPYEVTTFSLNVTTTFYLASVVTQTGCSSPRNPVVATILPVPTSSFNANAVCENTLAQNLIQSTVNFTGAQTNANTQYNWSCDGCLPGAPTTAGPHQLSWSAVGTKTLTLQTINPGAPTCSSTVTTVLITVNPTPTSAFTVAPNPLCTSTATQNNSATATFTGINAQSNTIYTWNCNGCVAAPTTAGPHTLQWSTPGVKSVTLAVNNPGAPACSSLTSTVLVTVLPTPTATFTAQNVCANVLNSNTILSSVAYTGTSTAGATFNWICDGCVSGAPTSIGPHQLSWGSSGVKTLTLQVINPETPACTSATVTALVTINSVPTSLFTVSPAEVCVSASTTNTQSTLTFTGNAQSGATYSWGCDGCTGLTQTQGPHTLSWAGAGIKTLSLQVVNPENNFDNSKCSSSVTTALVTVHPAPTSAFTAAAVCQNQANANFNSALNFTGNLPTGYAYNFSWNCAGCLPGAPTTEGPHTVSWNTSGTKTLTLQVTTVGTPSCASPPTSVVVTVHPAPNPTFTISPVICTSNSTSNNTAALNFTGSAATAAIFTWGCDGCITPPNATQGPFTLSWATPGTRTISLSILNNSVPPCEAGVVTGLVTVNPTPTNAILVATPNICQNTAISNNTTTTLSYNGNALPGAIFTWNCDGCVGLTQTQGPHTVSWATSGTKTITLQVANPGTPACTAPIVSVWVTVHPTPVPTFTAANACETASVTNIQSAISFTGSAQSGAIFTWNCNGCAPPPSPTAGPFTVSWSAPGTKTLTLQIENPGLPACLSPVQTVLVTVEPAPVSVFGVTPVVCTNAAAASFNATLTFNGANALASSTYTWACDGCASAPSATIGPHTVSWSTPGIKTITLAVSNPSSPVCTSPVSTMLVTVQPTPVPTFTAQNVCENVLAANTILSTINFTGTAAQSSQFIWNCAGCSPASLTGAGPHSVSWASSGVKTLTLSIINNGTPACASAVQSVLVTVNPVPTSSFSTAPNIVCVNPSTSSNTSVLTFTGTAVSGASYTWGCDGCAGLAQTIGPHTVSWTSIGVKTLTLQVTNPAPNYNNSFCASTISSLFITVNPVATSSFTAANSCSNASTVNTQSNVTFTGALPPGFAYVYTWNCDGCISGNPTTEGPHQLSWSGAGVKTLTLSVANNGSPACPSPVTTVLVTVLPTPNPAISITPSVCTSVSTANHTATLTHTGTAANGATFTWNCDGCVPNPSATGGPFNISWASSGVKTVTLSIQNNSNPVCISTVATALITVNPTPESNFTVSAPIICSSAATAATQTTLSFTGMALPGATFSWNCDGCSGLGQGVGPHTVSWASPGTKTIALTVANPGSPVCISNITSVGVTVNPTPINAFTAPNVCVQTSLTNNTTNLTFTGSALPGAQYLWNCDGCVNAPSTTAGPFSVSWSGVGTKSVTLQVINPQSPACSSAINTVLVVVHPIPAPSFTSTPAVCTGGAIANGLASLTYTGTAENNATFSWNCDGCANPPAATQGPFQISWGSCGVKSLQLTVTNPTGGCQALAPPVITTVHQTPNPAFTAPPSLCTGKAGVFQHTGAYNCNFTSYTPTFSWACTGCSGFSPSLPGPINVSWAQHGVQTISLSVTLTPGNCAAVQTQTVTVNATPVADFSVVSPVCVNSPALVMFTGQSGVGTGAANPPLYLWSCPSCAFAPPNTVGPHQLSWPTPGFQQVTLQVVNQPSGCSSNVASKNVQVITAPPAPVIDDVYRCGPGQVVLTPSSAIPPGHQIRWYNTPPYTTIAGNQSSFPAQVQTTTTFYVGYFNPLTGCETKSMVVAYVRPVPSAPIVNNVARCGSGSVAFTLQMGSVAGEQFHIYSLPNAMSAMASIPLPGNTYSTPGLNQNYTFYIATSLAATGIPAPGCFSPRIPAQAIIHTPPAPPNTWGTKRCGPGAVTISATMNQPFGDKIHVYEGANLAGSAFAPFRVNLNVSTTTLFSVVAVQSATGCESSPQDVLVEVIAPPAPPLADDAARCSSGTVTVTAVLGAPAGDGVRVYTQSVGGTPILTVDSANLVFGLGVISTTTFYLESYLANAQGCLSPRSALIATVHPIPPAPLVQNGRTCGAGNVFFSLQPNAADVYIAVYDDPLSSSPIANLYTPPLQYTASVFQTQKFYFENVYNSTGCRGPRAEAVAQVFPIPNPPFAPDVARCGAGRVTFTPQFDPLPGRVARLQHVCDGGAITSATASQNLLVLPYNLQTHTSFFIQVYDTITGCSSQCHFVMADIRPIPSEPIASNLEVCPGAGAVITAQMGSVPGEKIFLYDAPNNATAIQTLEQAPYVFGIGAHYLPTTYYLVAETLGCRSARVPVQVRIQQTPAAPGAVPLYRCGAGAVTFTATPGPHTPIIEVYDQMVGGSPIQTQSVPPYTFHFSNLEQTTTFYFAGLDLQTGCRSQRNAVLATILPLPPDPAPVPVERCGKGSATIDVPHLILPGGEVRLYTTPAAAEPFSMDPLAHYNLLTPEVETTTTFWVESYNYNTGCASRRIAVTLTIFPIPQAPPARFEKICAPGGNLSLTLQGLNPGEWARLYETQGSTIALDTALAPAPFVLKTSVGETTTFWHAISNYVNGNQISSCESERTPIFVAIEPLPPSPVVPELSLCRAGILTFTAYVLGGSADKVSLYERPSNLLLLTQTGVGGSFEITLPMNQSRSFSITAENTASSCKSAPTFFEVPILSPPAPPLVSSIAICEPGTVTFSFASSLPAGDYIRIYEGLISSAPSATLYAPPYTWSVTANTTTVYYASFVKANGCESDRVPFSVALHPRTLITTDTLLAMRCNAGSVVFNLPNHPEVTLWRVYANPTQSVPLFEVEGPTFTTPFLTQDTDYWIAGYSPAWNCESRRFTAKAKVNFSETELKPWNSLERCGPGIVFLNLAGVDGLSGVWQFWDANQQFIGSFATPTSSGFLPLDVTQSGGYTYRFIDSVSQCTTERQSLSVTIHPLPEKPEIENKRRCGAGKLTFQLKAPSAYNTLYYSDLGLQNIVSSTSAPTGFFETRRLEVSTVFYALSQDPLTGCRSEAVPLAADILPLPATPAAMEATICGAGNYSFTLPTPAPLSNFQYLVYESLIPAVLLEELSPNTLKWDSPYIQDSQTWLYTVKDLNTGCESLAGSLQLNALPKPRMPWVSNTSICLGETVSIPVELAGADANRILLLDNNQTLIAVKEGAPWRFSLSGVMQTSTYYVRAENALTGCQSQGAPIEVLVNLNPLPPAAQKAARCGAGSVTFSPYEAAEGALLVIYHSWPAGAGRVLENGAPFITPRLTETTTFWAQTLNAVTGCKSSPVEWVAEVHPEPIASEIPNRSLCYPGGVTQLQFPTLPGVARYALYREQDNALIAEVNNNNLEEVSVFLPSIEQTTDYYLVAHSASGNCRSAPSRFKVEVLPAMSPPQVAASPICRGQTATLLIRNTEPGARVEIWDEQNILVAVSPLQGNFTYTTPPLSQNVTWSLRTWNPITGCASPNALAHLIAHPVPTAPLPAAVRRCGAGEVSFSIALAGSESIEVYTSEIGGAPVASGNATGTSVAVLNFFVQTNTRYYLQVKDFNTGCVSARGLAPIEVIEAPPAPLPQTLPFCQRAPLWMTPRWRQAELPDGLSVFLYEDETSESPLASAATFPFGLALPALATTATFYLESAFVGGVCKSGRIPIIVEKLPLPSSPLAANSTRCGPGTVIFEVSAERPVRLLSEDRATVWAEDYTSPYRLNTPFLAANASFIIETWDRQTGCSTEVKVDAIILPLPKVNVEDAFRCGGGALTFTFNITPPGASLTIWNAQNERVAEAFASPLWSTQLGQTSNFTARAQFGECFSESVAFKGVIHDIPTLPLITDQEVCVRGQAAFVEVPIFGAVQGQSLYIHDLALAIIDTLGEVPRRWLTSVPAGVQKVYQYLAQDKQTGCYSAEGSFEIRGKEAPVAEPLYSTLCEPGIARRALNLPFAIETIRLYDPSLSWQTPLQTLTAANSELVSNYVQSDHTFYWVITASNGCQSEPIVWRTTVAPPIPAPLIESINPLCAGDSLKLRVILPLAEYNVLWILPGGQQIEGNPLVIPAFQPSDNGLYHARFVSAQGCASLAASTFVRVKPSLPLPQPVFYNYFKENIAFCPHNEVNFFIANYPEFPDGVQFEWLGPNGFYSLGHPQPGLPAPRSAADNGIYKVRAFMEGCTTEWAFTDSLIINPKPEAPQIMGADLVCLNGQEIALAVVAPLEQPYYWIGPGNFLATATHIARPASVENLGVYSVVTQNSAGCFSDTTLFEVGRFEENFRVVSYTASLCEGDLWQISLESSAPLTYHLQGVGWDTLFTGSHISLPNATVLHTGVYTLTAQYNGCALPPQRLPLQVWAAPSAPLILGKAAFCNTEAPFFEVSSPFNAEFVGTRWYLNGILQGEGQKLMLPSGLSPGLYTLEAYHYERECVSAARTHIFEVFAPPSAPQIMGNRTICYGDTLLWEAVSTVSEAQFFWRGPGNFYKTGKYLERILPEAGVYSVGVVVNGCTAYASSYLDVRPIGAPPILESALFSVCSGSHFRAIATLPGASSFLWQYPNAADWQESASGTLFLPAVNATHAGVYSVRARVDGCLTAPASFTLAVQNLSVPVPTSNQNSFCVNERAHLRELSGVGEKYLWSGPNGFYRETTSPDLFFTANSLLSGVYSVQYIRNGCTSAVANLALTIRPLPSPPVIRHNHPQCVGQELLLEAIPAIPGTRYYWQGPNFAAEGVSVARQLSQKQMEGIYSVVAIQHNCTSAPANAQVLLREPPPAPQIIGASEICEGKSVHWEARPSGNYLYQWHGPGGFSGQGQEISFTAHPGAAGMYSVTALDGGCVSLPSVTSLLVHPLPTIELLESNAPVCAGNILRLTALSVGAGRYFWVGPSTFSMVSQLSQIEIPVLSTTQSGIYQVYKVSAEGCVSNVVSNSVLIQPGLEKPILSAPASLCEGESLSLGATNGGSGSYRWVGPAGFISERQNPIIENVSVENSGVYSVYVYAGGCTSAVASAFIQVRRKPELGTITSNAPLCAGETLRLTATSLPGATYHWQGPPISGNSNFASNQAQPVLQNITTAQAGIYSLFAVLEGCSSVTQTLRVSVSERPTAPRTQARFSLCAGETLYLQAVSSGATQYLWQGPQGFVSSLANPTLANIEVGAGGIYSVVAINGGCTSALSLSEVTVTPSPYAYSSESVWVCSGANYQYAMPTVAGVQYQWIGPNGFSANTASFSITAFTGRQAGVYRLWATHNNCRFLVRELTIGLQECKTLATERLGQILVYPNPARNWVYIDTEALITEEPIYLEIIASNGAVAAQNIIDASFHIQSLDGLGSGIYTMRFTYGNQSLWQRLVIE